MSDKSFGVLIGVIIVAVIGAIVFLGGGSTNNSKWVGDPLAIATGEVDPAKPDQTPMRADHLLGTGEAKVTLIEFADFECPACFQFFPILKQVESTYGDQIDVVFRDFPLTSLHPNTFAAHRAAEAASNQNKFWEMHDLLYQRQQSWSRANSGKTTPEAAKTFEQFAVELKLDMPKYLEDVASQETFDIINTQINSGNQLGVTGTPTIYINGEEVHIRTLSDLTSKIDSLLGTTDNTPAANDAHSTN